MSKDEKDIQAYTIKTKEFKKQSDERWKKLWETNYNPNRKRK